VLVISNFVLDRENFDASASIVGSQIGRRSVLRGKRGKRDQQSTHAFCHEHLPCDDHLAGLHFLIIFDVDLCNISVVMAMQCTAQDFQLGRSCVRPARRFTRQRLHCTAATAAHTSEDRATDAESLGAALMYRRAVLGSLLLAPLLAATSAAEASTLSKGTKVRWSNINLLILS